MRVEGAIFDLDGTLVDTLDDIARAMNQVLGRHGLPQHATQAYRPMIGRGARVLVELAVPQESTAPIEDMLEEYKEAQADLTSSARPYEGVEELLSQLSRRGFPTAVVSNKATEAAVHLVQRLIPAHTFAAIIGAQENLLLKPNPTGARRALQHLGLAPERCAFVGDTEIDMQTARNSGMRAVGVAWGFRDAPTLQKAGAMHLAQTAAELCAIFLGDAGPPGDVGRS